MPRAWVGGLLALVAAVVMAACGSSYVAPSPSPGGGGVQEPPPAPNTPPQIKSIVASDTRVEVGTPITLTATVEDLETPVASLEFRWSADTGTFTGNGAVVTWSPGADAKTPAAYVITLTVAESFRAGIGSIVLENKATSTLTAHVNNSPKELAELSLRFLGDFANSRVSPDKCVSEFSDACSGGKRAEMDDITANRHDFEIVGSTLRHTSVQIPPARTTATVNTFCAFTSRVITTNPQSEGCKNDPSACKFDSVQSVEGHCWTTNVYQNGRWWLCTSSFSPLNALTAFERAFFGIRRPEI